MTVASYQVGDTQVVVPRRVEPERFQTEESLRVEPAAGDRNVAPGLVDFRSAVAAASVELQPFLHVALDWAVELERRGLASLMTHLGPAGAVLRVYIPDDMCFATVNCGTVASVQLWQTVFDRRAPEAKKRVEELIGAPVRQGTAVRSLDDALVAALTAAYEEAATGRITVDNP